jgi:trk/ktr system potassium uptake protein
MSNRVSHSLVKALRRVPAFAKLDVPALLELVGCSANLLWRDRGVVFRPGDPAEALYVVLSGRISIVEGDRGGREIATIRPGEYFGELALLLDTTHSKLAMAVGETELLVVPRESFRELLDRRPDLESVFRRRLEERVGLVTTRS